MPAKKQADKYAATTWGIDTEDLTCPSGQVCLVRRVDIMKLMSDGTLHKTDMLTSLVEQQHVAKKKQGGKNAARMAEADTESMLLEAIKDPVKMKELMDTVNSVVMATVVKPELAEVPEDDSDRVIGVVYVDTVDVDDRMFIMQYAFGGTRAAARFLEEFNKSIDRLANVKPVGNPTE